MTGDEYTECLLENTNYTAPNFSESNYNYTRNTTLKPLEYGDYVRLTAYVILFILGLGGNIGVILTVGLNRSMRTTINICISNLAMADLMICLFCMITECVGILTEPVYLFGPFMCKFNAFIQMTSLLSSVFTLSAISCDRFVAILFPLHARVTKQRTSIVIASIWTISVIVSVPLLIVRKHEIVEWKNFIEPKCGEKWPTEYIYDPSIEICVAHASLQIAYYTFASIILFFVPVVIMITAYGLILWKLWVSNIPGERHSANVDAQERTRRKVIKMVIAVLAVFVVCWMPLQMIVLDSAYTLTEHSLTHFTSYARLFAYANSSLNPIIYGGYNESFREEFWKIIKCQRRNIGPSLSQRSRLTVTAGIVSSTVKVPSAANRQLHATQNNTEMMEINSKKNGEAPLNAKETCAAISDLDEKSTSV